MIDMARVIYFHIGFNKTGTTALQHTLSLNRGLLQARGFAYPSEAVAESPPLPMLPACANDGVLIPLAQAT
jgi:hypothetical protein